MMVIQHEGGLLAGAFQGDRLLGYVFAFPTRDPQVQHSHRLAVRAEARGLKLGARLKWYQHDWCARNGVALVRWTYDPLRRTNATLNIAALGAGAHVYLPDYYGEMAGINAGTASDRLMAEWVIGSPACRLRAWASRCCHRQSLHRPVASPFRQGLSGCWRKTPPPLALPAQRCVRR
ncbi:GNAT family N-acetyltransferase [Gemmobacter lanyuensis]